MQEFFHMDIFKSELFWNRIIHLANTFIVGERNEKVSDGNRKITFKEEVILN